MPADFIEAFMEYSSDAASPFLFRQWAAIAAVAGAMERKCWVRTRRGAIFPNLYTLFVAPPGVGKSESIKITEAIWRGTKKLHVAPKRLTTASVVDAINSAEQIRVGGPGRPNYEFHSLMIPLTELGSFLSAYDNDMIDMLTDLYDNLPNFSEQRRHQREGKSLDISSPQLNIFAGTTPSSMSRLIPDTAWGGGFTSRLVMIYSGIELDTEDLWSDAQERNPEKLVALLSSLCDKYGEFKLTDSAKHLSSVWTKAGMPPVPQHSKLEHYLPRRILHFLKLAAVSGLSRTHQLIIDEEDIIRAQDWLLTAESTMPDIFRAMVQRSDTDIINELHIAMWRVWTMNQNKPVHRSMLWNFLQARAPADKIARIVEIAENANFIKRVPGSNEHWVPMPKQQHGVE